MANHSIPPFFKKLPLYLVLRHGDNLPKYVKLRMSNGAMWDVKISKTEDGNHCLTRGWSEFVKDTKLVEREYVCFYPDADGFTFDVVVFGENCCEKKKPVNDSDHDRVPTPQFDFRLKHWQKHRLPLRKEFVLNAGLLDKDQVTLEYGSTKKPEAVFVENRTKGSQFKFELARGWRVFHEENGLEVGRTYSFTFNHAGNVIQVQPVKEQIFHVAAVETDTSESTESDEN